MWGNLNYLEFLYVPTILLIFSHSSEKNYSFAILLLFFLIILIYFFSFLEKSMNWRQKKQCKNLLETITCNCASQIGTCQKNIFSIFSFAFFHQTFYLFAPELAHSSDCVRELQLSNQVALRVSSKSCKRLKLEKMSLLELFVI